MTSFAAQAVGASLAGGLCIASFLGQPQGTVVFRLNPKYSKGIFDKVPIDAKAADAARKKNQPRDMSKLEDITALLKKVPKKK
mmetsp:Transcript_41372/g.67113  ORF Transcript_41372/g.67113 Transcript_41372/m.67113 type:complete len:83 (-) Transcript_41372:224-472(-)|eukprot:CAMPEP_0184645156 /NCGR_PEP_ID=MMETSP0308-20130426/1693_1 /TAXON_ID=38269 /ORGANISM="Gloeochaete witrockiana, Strain SAG 46.84" /LENGTH=82 /DNA_ID=CAMNT_0027074005 /DNA_START=164 /DNA_END=412 /DNA_ORIENTATION=+